MSYVDAHVHLADPGYQEDLESILRCEANQIVQNLLSNATDYETSVKTVSISRKHEGRVFAAVGIHPWTIVQNLQQPVEKFQSLIEADKHHISAIGEIGLDGQYSQDEDNRNRQREIFKFFLQLAERKKLPVVVHSRLAVDETLEILSSFNLTGVLMHWYSGPIDKLRVIRDRGYLISIGPSVTYTKRIAEIARTADRATILTETDGPVQYYGPFKGKRTEPFFVVDVVKKLSEIRNEPPDTIRDVVLHNFHRFTGRNGYGK